MEIKGRAKGRLGCGKREDRQGKVARFKMSVKVESVEVSRVSFG